MNFFERNRPAFDTLAITILGTLALLMSLRVFPMAIFLLPIAFIVLGVNHGVKCNIIGLVATSIIVGFILDPSSAILIIILFLPLSIVLALMIRNQARPARVLVAGTISFFISILVLILLFNMFADINFTEALNNIVSLSFDNQLKALEGSGLSAKELKNIEDSYNKVRETLAVAMPSIFMIHSLLVTYLNYLLASIVLRKENYELKYRPVFSEFRLPKSIFLGTLVMLAMSFILIRLNILKNQAVYENIMVLVTFLFTIQGLAVISYKLKESSLNKVIRVIIFIIVLLLLFIFSRLVYILGMLDAIFDFRKLEPRSS